MASTLRTQGFFTKTRGFDHQSFMGLNGKFMGYFYKTYLTNNVIILCPHKRQPYLNRENTGKWSPVDGMGYPMTNTFQVVISGHFLQLRTIFDWMSLFSHKPTIFMHQQNLAGSTSDVWLLNLHHFSMVKRFNLPAFQTVETESTFSNFLSRWWTSPIFHHFSMGFPSQRSLPLLGLRTLQSEAQAQRCQRLRLHGTDGWSHGHNPGATGGRDVYAIAFDPSTFKNVILILNNQHYLELGFSKQEICRKIRPTRWGGWYHG